MSTKVKKIILLLLVLAVAGLGVGYFLWNKPHQDIASSSGIKTDAIELYQSFITDSVIAKKKYTEQVIEVSGVVTSVSVNQLKQALILLKTATQGAFINCTFEQEPGNFKEGQQIKIKGICTGIGSGDADLGLAGDVYLIRCYLAN